MQRIHLLETIGVRLRLMGTGLASRDDSNGVAFAPVAVAHHQQAQCAAQTQENKAFFIVRVIRIVNQLGAFVQKNGLGFVKAHAVIFFDIDCGFVLVPLKTKCAHVGGVIAS